VADRATLEVVQSNADAHDAVQAWRTFAGTSARVNTIDVLKETSKTAVYRLHTTTADALSVIAKRRRHEAIQYEYSIYADVLPRIPVPALVCHGWLPAGDELSWLFLEDSGGEELSYNSSEHMRAATRWVATAHAAASTQVGSARLPDRGANHYLRHLQTARETLERHTGNAALSAEEIELLRAVITLLDALEAQWSDIQSFSGVLPATFSHGDFVQKNVHVRYERGEIVVLPFDWETSGWGVAAADLTRADLDLYWSIVRDVWPNLTLQDTQRMASLGTMFRLLAAISWEAPSFRAAWVKRAALKMALYRDRVARVMDTWWPT
jgi:hypothetical protein